VDAELYDQHGQEPRLTDKELARSPRWQTGTGFVLQIQITQNGQPGGEVESVRSNAPRDKTGKQRTQYA